MVSVVREYAARPNAASARRLMRGLDVACGIVDRIAPRPDDVDLVITGDFVQSVRDRIPDAEAASNYNVKRGAGIVAAKTMPDLRTGRLGILVPFDTIAFDSSDGEALRDHTVAHESYHVATDQRGESNERELDHLYTSATQRDFCALASMALEEFRAELAVNEAGSFIAGSAELGDDFAAAREGFAQVVPLVWESDFHGAMNLAMDTLNVLCKRIAYGTASLVADMGRAAFIQHADTSEAGRLMGTLASVPSAAQPAELSQLDEAITAIGTASRGILAKAGFEYVDGPDEMIYFGFLGSFASQAS